MVAPLDADHVRRLDEEIAARQLTAAREVDRALASDRYVALLHALVAAAREPPTLPAADASAAQALPPLVLAAWKDLARSVGRLGRDDPDEEWHEARVRAKRARYAAEAVVPALGKRVRPTATAATAVQELLGEHQDSAAAETLFREIAASHPQDGPLSLTLGRLVERQRELIRAQRSRLPRTWKQLDPAKAVAWARG